MASVTHIIKSVQHVPKHLLDLHGTARHRGLRGLVADKGTRYAAMAGFSYAKGFYGNRFIWWKAPADLWIGLASYVLAAWASAATYGASKIAPTFERIGDAGVMSAIGSVAASYGIEHAGGKAVATRPKSIKGDILGAIAAAKAGPQLDPAMMANFAAARQG